MTDRKPHLLWPGANERAIVAEMLRDGKSGQWFECREFVRKIIEGRAKNIPPERRDDIVQDVMIRVDHYLPDFQFRCSLKTWLFIIIQSCIADSHRKLTHDSEHVTSLVASSQDPEQEDGILTVPAPVTVEDEYIVRDELAKALAALQEYISTHPHPDRNRHILHMVLVEGRSMEEAARAGGCSAAMASYIVRSAQRYAREKLGRQRPPDRHP